MRKPVIVGIVAILWWSVMPADPTNAAYRGDNGRIVVASTRHGGNFQLYVIEPDGSNPKRLTTSTGVDLEPAWSPDGTRIVFDSTRDGNRDIYVINADGSGERRLTTHPAAEGYATWSPDGRRVAFMSNRAGNFDIFTVDVAGTEERQLTVHPGNDRFPVWAPRGGRIAFSSVRDGNEDVYIMDHRGNDVRRLTADPSVDTQPAWAPSGAELAFISLRSGNRDIFALSPGDATEVRQLTATASNEFGLAYSPDGRFILYTSDAEEVLQIWLAGSDGSSPARITSGPGNNIHQDWQPLPTGGPSVSASARHHSKSARGTSTRIGSHRRSFR